MPLAVTLPILCALGARIAFTLLNPPLTPPLPSEELIDGAVQGAFQGVLLQYVSSEHPVFAPALALAFVGRIASIVYFADAPPDMQVVGVTGIAAVVGFALTQLLSLAADEWMDEDELSIDRRHSRRRERELAREMAREARKEHMRARLREINARERDRDRSRSPSVRSRSFERVAPRRSYVTRARSASLPRTEHTTVPPTLITETTSTTLTMEQMGYTGLGRLLDLELANLRKKAATAEADRRRCKEERKWALAQGDKARAEQLAWQVKRYAAMAESYTREADRKIIEATRANHPGQLSAAAAASTPTQANPYYGVELDTVPSSNGHGASEVPYPDYMNKLRKDIKGKAPMRYPDPPNTNGFAFDSGWQTSKAYA
ncbi:hypothetical protein ACEPAH_6989 [Sanghuangporus vaninii]